MKRQLLWTLILLVITVPATSALANEPAPSVAPVVNTGELIVTLGAALAGLLAAFVTGTITGLASVVMLIRNLDANTKLAIERLAVSLPPDALERIREIIRTVREAAEIAGELTDGRLPTDQPKTE